MSDKDFAIGANRIRDLMAKAIASHERRDYPTAEASYREILRLAPEYPDAVHFSGVLAHQTGHTSEGLKLLRRSLELNPNSSLYRFNLAGVYEQSGAYADAEHFYREALAIKPDYVDASVGLAIAETKQGKYQAALHDYEHALSKDTRNYPGEIGRIKLLLELGNTDEAVQACQRSIHNWNHDAKKLQAIGLALHEAGADTEAVECFGHAIEISPRDVEAYNSLGRILGDLGQLREAESHYREALRLQPDHVGAFYNLVNLTRLSRMDPLWVHFSALDKQTGNLSPNDTVLLYFALGKAWEDNGNYANAFSYFLRGNRLKRAAINYDEDRQVQFTHNYMHYFDSDFITTHSLDEACSDTPIFIIGMPRSGTTLIEQILSSHPLVYGAGETQQLWRCLRVELGTTENDDDDIASILSTKNSHTYRRVAQHYLESLNQRAQGHGYTTNKLSGNMTLVGFIHMTFPNAKIIHCVRNPMDTCTSCFGKLFASGNLFSYDLGELGRFFRLYEQLMQHWHRVLPDGGMLEVHYEDVVANTEDQTRRMLAYCGLPWDAECLKFYKTKRTVRTASLVQVRQPIYTTSIGRGKRYEAYLDPLKSALAG